MTTMADTQETQVEMQMPPVAPAATDDIDVDALVADVVSAVHELHEKLSAIDKERDPTIREIRERIRQHKIEHIYQTLKQ